ncbi:MAG: cell division protein FtsZ, partial [Pseudonocardiales bacterium]
GLFEINEAASLVADAAHPDANIIFGAVIDDALGDEVRVTVIAAGFDGGSPSYKKAEPRRTQVTVDPPRQPQNGSRSDPVEVGQMAQAGSRPAERPRRTVVFDDDLDVPDFLK